MHGGERLDIRLGAAPSLISDRLTLEIDGCLLPGQSGDSESHVQDGTRDRGDQQPDVPIVLLSGAPVQGDL